MITPNMTTEYLQRIFDEEVRLQSDCLVYKLLYKSVEPHLEKVARAVQYAMPELLAIVEQSHHTPMHEHRRAIYRILLDQDRVPYEPGNSVHAYEDHIRRIEQITLELINLLEAVRRSAISCGEWSESLAPPQFFG